MQREVRCGGCAAPCEAQGAAKVREHEIYFGHARDLFWERGSHVQSPLFLEIRHSRGMEIVTLESFEKEDVRRCVGAVGGGAVPY